MQEKFCSWPMNVNSKTKRERERIDKLKKYCMIEKFHVALTFIFGHTKDKIGQGKSTKLLK